MSYDVIGNTKFYDEVHEEFYLKCLQTLKKNGLSVDCYRKSICYLLALTNETRKNIDLLFDLRLGSILDEGLNSHFQTGTTSKLCRLAFNLYNGWQYENMADWENNQVSSNFATAEIFCCSFAPYFYEAIKLRYPEYTKE